MSTQNKTERVQLLMTLAELAAIDDWGFSNRIRTRAEAIRRLCQIGVRTAEIAETQSRPLPEGWKLVPVQPTQRMIEAGMKERHGHRVYDYFADDMLSAMEDGVSRTFKSVISRSPEPPATFQGGAEE